MTNQLPESASTAALAYLRQHPWVVNKEAGNLAYLLNLKCEAGWDYCDDESVPLEERISYSGTYPERLIKLAEDGDKIAHQALCEIGSDLTRRHRSLPSALQQYLVGSALTPPAFRKARHPASYANRDEAIFFAVELVIAMGFRPTRNVASLETQSACSIVSEALGKCRHISTEQNVASIWRRRRKVRKAAGFKVFSDVQN